MTFSYRPPLRKIQLTHAAMGSGAVLQAPRFEHFDLEVADELLRSVARVCTDRVHPTNVPGDREGVQLDGDRVVTPIGFAGALASLAEIGVLGLMVSREFDGIDAPEFIGVSVLELLMASNKSLSMLPQLAAGVARALQRHASPEVQAKTLRRIANGEAAATLCLTEPQCGSDLSLVTTSARREGESYRVTGVKQWISFGDHELTTDIFHLVLARLPGSPSGLRGLTAFIVPKVRPDGARNAVRVIALESKMGLHGSPTCTLQFDGAEAWLVGRENGGLGPIMTMLDMARVHVGMEGVALGEYACQLAEDFAQQRRQGRALNPSKREPEQVADRIVVHPTTRKMLAQIRSTTDFTRALIHWIAVEYDQIRDDDEVSRDIVELLSPVAKVYGTRQGFENISTAIQVCGGLGYVTDFPMEQLLRDLRVAMIYEGTNHIVALDLVGNRLLGNRGRQVHTFHKRVKELAAACGEVAAMTPAGGALLKASEGLVALTVDCFDSGRVDVEQIDFIADDYCDMVALVALLYSGCSLCMHAHHHELPEFDELLADLTFFTSYMLPQSLTLEQRIRASHQILPD